MNNLIELVLRRRMRRTKTQQLFLGYIILIAIVLFAFPIFRIQELDAVDATHIRFLGSGMYWLILVILIALVKLIGLNLSPSIKKTAYRVIGRNNNEHLDNITILFFLLLIMLTMSGTIGFYGHHISTIVTTTRTLLIVELLLLIGIFRQLVCTRLQWKKLNKKNGVSQTTKVPYDIDSTNKEHIFSSSTSHQDKSLEGLFGQ